LARFRWQRRLWALIAGALTLVRAAPAVIAAPTQAARDAPRAHAAFVSTSQTIEGTLALEIEHETYLFVSAGGFVAGRPGGLRPPREADRPAAEHRLAARPGRSSLCDL
jgi:hypothetical protein